MRRKAEDKEDGAVGFQGCCDYINLPKMDFTSKSWMTVHGSSSERKKLSTGEEDGDSRWTVGEDDSQLASQHAS